VVPRPAARRGGRPLALTHALVACDLNTRYLRLWPLARRAWTEIARLEPMLVLIAEHADVPAELANDASVRVFEPVPSLHTAFQAQCIRLLYPALLDAEGVVVSDIDMVPLNSQYLARPAAHVSADDFVAYRDVVLELEEIPICYNAARPAVWSSVFGVDDLDGVRARLTEWAEGIFYAGEHGGDGWTTDQLILYRTLLDRGRRSRDVWILDDYYTRFRRLMREYVEKWSSLSDDARDAIEQGRFSDFHLLWPDSELASLNEVVIDLAVAAERRRRP
jgi:hypothetical protein